MNELPWHAPLWMRLQSRRERGALAHALLLCGPRGLGKRDFLVRFVRGLLCRQPQNGEACGECRSCLLMHAGTHPDYVALSYGLRKDGVQRAEIVVDQIRELSQRLATSSQYGGWQIASIDPADAMNAAAANALLKTLEEPATQTMLILVADAPWRLPATIRSRCQRVEFQPPAEDEALHWLQSVGVRDAPAALAVAGGNPGLARIWFEDGTLKHHQDVRNDLIALAAGRGDAMQMARRWLDDGPELRLWFAAQVAAEEIRARSVTATGPLLSAMNVEQLGHWYDSVNRAREALRGPLRGDLVLLEL